MAKRLNKKVIVGLTVAGMALTTAAGVIMVLNLPKKDPQQFVLQAEQAVASKNYKQAATFYQGAYKRATSAGFNRATSCEYLTLAGEMLLKAGDARNAVSCWQKVILDDPQNMKAQEDIVKFYMELADLQGGNAWGLLQTRAEQLCRTGEQSNSKNFFGLYALGRALIAQRALKESNASEGKKNLIEAVNGDKSNQDYAKALADYYLSEGNLQEAIGVYDVLMANLPHDSEKAAKAYLNRGMFYAMDKVAEKVPDAEPKALADLTKAVELAPQNVDCLVGLGGYWHAKKLRSAGAKAVAADIEEYRAKAKQYYETAIKADPDHYSGYLQLMQLHFEDHKLDEALKVVNERLQRGPNREHYLGWRDKQYKALLLNYAFNINLAKLNELGKTATVQADYDRDAQAIKDRLTELHKDVVAELGEDEPMGLLMQGRLMILQNDAYAAIKALEKAEKLTPGKSLEMQRLLGELYARTGSPGLAEESLKFVLSALPNDANSWASLALVLSQLQRPEDALAAADHALSIDPQNALAIRAKMDSYGQQKNYEGLKETQKQLSALQNTTSDKLNRALILRLQGTQNNTLDTAKLAEAEKLLRELVAADPLHFTAIRNLVGILVDVPGKNDKALEVLATARSAAEKKLAEVTATQPTGERKNQLDRIITNLDMLKISADPNANEEDRIHHMEEVIKRGDDPYVVALDMFQLYQNHANHLEDAFKALKDAYKLRPNEASVVDALFTFSLAEKDWTLAEELIDKAVALGFERSGGHFYRGQLILAKGTKPDDFEGAVREFQQGLTEMPSFAEGHALLGRAYLSMNKFDEAKQSFSEARRLNPQHSGATVGLAMVADMQHDEAEKQKYLELCAEVAPNHPWAREQLQESADKRDPKKGIARREELRKQNPKDTENLIKLAALYANNKNFDQAKSLFEESVKIAPKDLRVARAYAIYLSTKEPPEMPAARELLTRLVQSFDDNSKKEKAGAQLLLAAHLEDDAQTRRPDAAKPEEVDAAYIAAAGFSDTGDIYAEVANYFMREKGFARADNAKAEEWFRKAISVPEDKLSKLTRQRSHQYLIQTMVRAMDPTKTELLQKEISTYREKYPDDPYGILFEAEYHTAAGQDLEALKDYTEFLGKQTNSSTGHYRRALAHFRRSEWEEAAKDLTQVKRLNPNNRDFQPRIFLAQALRNRGQAEAAITEMQSILSEPGFPPTAIQMLFDLYMELKRYDGAQSLIETRSKANPDMPIWDDLRMRLALTLKNYPVAIQIAQAAVEKSRLDARAVDLLLNVYLQAERYDDLINFVEQKVPADKQNPAVLLRMASAYAGKKDPAKAVEMYTKAFALPNAELSMFPQALNDDLRKRISPDVVLQNVSAQLQAHPDDRALKLLMAIVQTRKGDREAGIKTLDELLAKTDASRPEEQIFILRELAAQLYEQKNRDRCRAAYEQILKLRPDDVFSLNNLACLLMDDFNDPKSSLDYSKKVAAALPNNGGVLDTLGWNLVLIGDFNKGIAQLGKAVEFQSRLAALHYHLAEAFWRRSQSKAVANKESDLNQAKAEITLAHKLIIEAGEDSEHVLDKVVATGEQLGIKLDKNLGAATRPTS